MFEKKTDLSNTAVGTVKPCFYEKDTLNRWKNSRSEQISTPHSYETLWNRPNSIKNPLISFFIGVFIAILPVFPGFHGIPSTFGLKQACLGSQKPNNRQQTLFFLFWGTFQLKLRLFNRETRLMDGLNWE